MRSPLRSSSRLLVENKAGSLGRWQTLLISAESVAIARLSNEIKKNPVNKAVLNLSISQATLPKINRQKITPTSKKVWQNNLIFNDKHKMGIASGSPVFYFIAIELATSGNTATSRTFSFIFSYFPCLFTGDRSF